MLARRIRSTTQLNMGVESVSLESLDDYEATGEFLAKAIQVSLDQEWLKQDIHAEIGARVKEIYIETRASGDAEVSSVLMNVGEDLAGRDLHPAFVGGWDVANLASDFLLQRLYGEEAACACNARVPAEVWAVCGLETAAGGGGGEGQP